MCDVLHVVVVGFPCYSVVCKPVGPPACLTTCCPYDRAISMGPFSFPQKNGGCPVWGPEQGYMSFVSHCHRMIEYD